MHRKYNKFLIVSFVGVLVLGVYSYFHNDFSEAASSESSITSSLDSTTASTTAKSNESDKATEDTAFLMKLASLTKINIDTSLFSDQAFKLLVDNNIKLEPVPYGRANPFSPTNDPIILDSKPVIPLKTNAATAVTASSAVLNGSIEGVTSTNIYFEYGTTETLGKVTPKVTSSLVGSFASNVTQLTPKTKYFFRSASNIDGVMTFGEIISFNTN